MTFLDRFEAQLLEASTRLQSHATPDRPESQRRSWHRRSIIAPVLALALAGPALAIVQPWNPSVGRTDDRLATSTLPVDPRAVDVLSILRRPQTPKDRAIAEPLLGRLNGPLNGVQLADIRAIRPGLAVVPVQSFDAGDNDRAGGPQICLISTGPISCNPIARVAANGVVTQSASYTQTKYIGIVPDGVSRVRFTPADGSPSITASASNNYVRLIIPKAGRTPPTHAPNRDGTPSERLIPGPPIPIDGTLDFLNDKGDVVGPSSR